MHHCVNTTVNILNLRGGVGGLGGQRKENKECMSLTDQNFSVLPEWKAILPQ